MLIIGMYLIVLQQRARLITVSSGFDLKDVSSIGARCNSGAIVGLLAFNPSPFRYT
jgi:hypothetical protein